MFQGLSAAVGEPFTTLMVLSLNLQQPVFTSPAPSDENIMMLDDGAAQSSRGTILELALSSVHTVSTC